MQSSERDNPTLIGHHDLLNEAHNCLSDKPGHRRIILVSGSRGMGKSAFVNAIEESARTRGCTVEAVQCGSATGGSDSIGYALDTLCRKTTHSIRAANDTQTTEARGLLLIDDLHHLDETERGRVAATVKRAARKYDLRCIATTTDDVPPPAWREFSLQTLRPLTDDEIRTLLQVRGFTEADSHHAVALAEGNPLAAIELSRATFGHHCIDLAPIPPVTGPIEEAGSNLFSSLDRTERASVLRDLLQRSVLRAVQEAYLPPRAGLHNRALANTDVTARLLVHARATPDELLTAHHELAEDHALPNHVRMIHRALASDTANDDLVDRLEFLAEDLVAALRYRPATAVLCRAAALATDSARTSALLTRAGSVAAFAGHLDIADAVVSRERLHSYRTEAASMAAASAFLSFARGCDVRSALSHVVVAIDSLAPSTHPDSLNQLIASCLAYAVTDGDVEAIDRAVNLASTFRHVLDPINVLISRTLSQANTTADVRALDDRALQGAVLASLRDGEPWKPVLLYLALPILCWHPREYRWLNEHFDIRNRLCPSIIDIDLLKSEAREAARGHRASSVDRNHHRSRAGSVNLFCGHRQALARLVSTLRGDPTDMRKALVHERAGLQSEVYDAAVAIDLISRNRHAAAFERLHHHNTSVLRWLHSPYGPLEMIDFVECCVRLSEPGEGIAYLDRFRLVRPNFWSARDTALMLVAEAVLAETDNAVMFERALHELRKVGWPFDVPRAALAYGEWLRRHHRVVDSRRQLIRALDLFDQLEAVPWVRRAEDELRAAGYAHRDFTGFAFTELTSQEYRIASMAASGLTNKEIGQALYLSARTVGGHLYRVFPKLQITKRSALRDAIARYDEQLAPQTSSMAG